MADVALVAMPFGPLLYPSMSLSLLQPGLVRRGYSCDVFYFMLDYAERVGMRFYVGISHSRQPPLGRLAGEWIFAGQLFERSEADIQRYVDEILEMRLHGTRRASPRIPRRTIERIVEQARDAGAFLDECVERLLRARARVVGLTSTFQQHAAALALAKRIKAAAPDVVTILGGPNCEGVMGAETSRQFPFVDAVVSGEGDVALPEIVRRALAGETFDDMPGVFTPRNVHAAFAAERFDNTAPVLDLDTLPEADFDDYLNSFARTRFNRDWEPRLLYETSRGCWWGERMHCTFCGLNGATMKYRSKSPARAIGEMRSIARRYPRLDIDVTDNILDLAYFDSVLPELARLRIKGTALFYETKSNLKKEQVRILRDAGIRRIQPGIESLSDTVLKMMRKGVTALQNIQLIKWCTELGVLAQWNVLVGFPGEPPEEYERMTKMLPLLSHLQPQQYFIGIRMDRFSPNFFDAERLGFTNLRPFEAYQHVYQLPPEAVHNMACFFNFDYRQPQDVDGYALPLRAACAQWQADHPRSALFFVDDGEHLAIWDLRPVARHLLTILSGLDRRLYLACDGVAYAAQLARTLGDSEEAIRSAAALLVDRGLMLRDGDRLLALAIALSDEYTPPPQIVARFRRMVRAAGGRAEDGIAVRCDTRSPEIADRPSPRKPRMRRLHHSQFTIDSDSVILH
ncbi:MAG TPA: RiPP maturation radical SAM C-methyltransferase [Thermoanaerobaculia bacterium]|nr:RiPP maturation radical SAM C-methyltransferase [Thermoanaerobaculia bacterium]